MAVEQSAAVEPGAETRTVQGYCGLCAVHCPTVTTVAGDQVLSVEAPPPPPQPGAICAKGRAAPEFLDHPERVNYPMRRTRPKTDPDPGWERITWDEALDLIAARLLAVRETDGPQAVAFSKGTSGGTGLNEVEPWLGRLTALFGTPNVVSTTHLCQWPRDTAAASYTFGADRLPMPDLAHSACILLWGTNPNGNYLSLAQDVVAAKARGAKLLVIDPRRVGPATRADVFLQVRPGTDGALALSLIHLLIAEGRYDEPFVREWTNAPLLVRGDSGDLLLAADVAPGQFEPGTPPPTGTGYVAVRTDTDALVPYDAGRGVYAGGAAGLGLRGTRAVRLADGQTVACQPVFERLAAEAAQYPPEAAATITGASAEQIVAAARLLADNRPVGHYFHNGLVQHTNATQACRGIAVLYALLGDWDRAGGNVLAPGPRVNSIAVKGAVEPEVAARRLGRAERPLGPPARPGAVAAYDLYDAVLQGSPYPVRALVSFGGNMLLANGDTLRGRQALEALEFYAQVELTHTPTSQYADVVLPAASFLEFDALHLGFRYPVEAMAHVQRRPAAIAPRHERRADVAIVFDLACRLGFADQFWDGDVAAAYDYVLAPSDLTWDALAERPHGVTIPRHPLRHQGYAQPDPTTGDPKGFATPTRKVELYAVPFAQQGQPPLPTYVEPALSPVSQPALAAAFPLVLTNAKRPQFLHSQHRGLARLRKTLPHPTAELHPATAAEHGIADGAWVALETPSGSVRVQARLTEAILPGVVCTSHGWWQGCEPLGLPPLDPFSADGANVNLLVHNAQHDPISGGTPHRSTICRLRPLPPA
jgi:anaerobic selenocysteine-containing dehydrogenase